MLIKIKGRTQERFNETLKSIMNIASIVFGRGRIPTPQNMEEPKVTGLFWFENIEEDKFELLPVQNDHKAFIRERGVNSITVEFYSRYDKNNKQTTALSNLIMSMFGEDEVELISDNDTQL